MSNAPSRTADATPDPLVEILRCCAAVAPAPWYPRVYAKAAGVPLAELAVEVEFLWKRGLLRTASRPGDVVPGVTLTDAGARALADPGELARVRGATPTSRGRGTAARRALGAIGPPVVSWCLLAVNLLVFGAGFWMASSQGAGQAFLAGNGSLPVYRVWHRSGSVSADDVIAGQWWRLETAAFVHGGLLHLLLNMSLLAFGLGLIEAMWGRLRFLLIYLCAGFGGDCLAVAYHPDGVLLKAPGGAVEVGQSVVGASGALCGVLAAAAVWLVFNGRHLPQRASAQLRTGLIASAVFLVFISLFPGVSGLGHLGGVLFGAAAAALLHLQRWGTRLWRWAAVAGLFALPAAGLAVVDRQLNVDPRWRGAERRVLQTFDQRMTALRRESARVHDEQLAPLTEAPPRKRDSARTDRALVESAEVRQALLTLARDLARTGPYVNAEWEAQRISSFTWARDEAGRLAAAEDVLRRNVPSPEADEADERKFTRQFLGRIPDTMRRAIVLYRDEVQPLVKTPPGERDAAAVEKVLAAMAKSERELSELVEALREAGPYGNAQVERARQTAERYASARAAQLANATKCLRAGAAISPADEETLQTSADRVTTLRHEWEEMVEKR